MKKCRRFRPTIKPIVPIEQQSKIDTQNPMVRSSLLVNQTYIDTIDLNVNTCLDAIYNGLELSHNGDCVGYFNHLKQNYTWLSYSQTIEKMRHFGSGLVQLGCKASNFTKISIYSVNRVEWCIAQYAAYHYSMVVVPLYDSLGSDARLFILNQSECECIVVDTLERVRRILQQIPQLPWLQMIISMDNNVASELMDLAKQSNVGLYTFNQIERPHPNNLAMIMYTSGTTGQPKGAMLTHSNFIASASGLAMQMECNMDIGSLSFLSFLPMAHSFEQCVQCALLMKGARIGYFGGQMKKLQADMHVFRPTALIMVPRLLNRVYNSVLAQVRASQPRSLLLRTALSVKQKQISNFVYYRNSIWDRLVFRRLRAKFGGQVKLLACGSAPLSPTILNFFRCALGCIVVEGYGQTESCGATCASFPGDYTAVTLDTPSSVWPSRR